MSAPIDRGGSSFRDTRKHGLAPWLKLGLANEARANYSRGGGNRRGGCTAFDCFYLVGSAGIKRGVCDLDPRHSSVERLAVTSGRSPGIDAANG